MNLSSNQKTATAAIVVLLMATVGIWQWRQYHLSGSDAKTPSVLGKHFLVSDKLKNAKAECDNLLQNTILEAPFAPEIRKFYQVQQDCRNPKLAKSATDSLYTAWENDPENIIWLESAVYNWYQRGDHDQDYKRLMSIAERDTNSAVYHFTRARRRMHDTDTMKHHLCKADSLSGEFSPVQQVWLQRSIAYSEAETGRAEVGIDRLIDALPLACKLGGVPMAYSFWSNISTYSRQAGLLDDAVFAAEAALECANRDNNPILKVKSLISLVKVYEQQGQYSEALEFAAASYKITIENSYGALSYLTLAYFALIASSLDQISESIQYLKEGYDISRADGNMRNIVRSSVGLSGYYLSCGKPDSAAIWLQLASSINDNLPDDRLDNPVDSAWISYYSQIGNYSRVDSLIVATMAVIDSQTPDAYWLNIQMDMISRGLAIGRPDLAYHALEQVQNRPYLGPRKSSNSDPQLEFELLTAHFLAQQGEFRQAQQRMSVAESRLEATSGVMARYKFHRRQAEIATLANDFKSAEKSLSLCMDLANEIENRSMMNYSRVRLGRNYLLQNKLQIAKDLFLPLRDTRYYWPRISASLFLGQIAAKKNNHVQALDYYAEVDSLLGNAPQHQIKQSLLLAQGKSLAALEQPRAALKKWREIKINSKDVNIVENNENLRAYNRQTTRLVTEAMVGLLYDNPQLADGQTLALTTLALVEELRWTGQHNKEHISPKQLGDFPIVTGAPVQTFFVGNDRIFSWVGTSKGWTLSELPETEELLDLVASLQIDMETPDRIVDWQNVQKLSDMLLSPVGNNWHSDSPLHILPDGFLANIPWPALSLPMELGSSELQLVDHGSVVILTSLVMPNDQPESILSTAESPKLVIGIDGVPDLKSSDPQLLLHFAEAEAKAVASILPSDQVTLLLGQEARWSQVKKMSLEKFKTIHIATHARVTEGLPGRSTLRFAGVGEKPVTIPEIRKLNLDADLVFVSGCESARLSVDTGSGLNSFSRAFLQAGAKSVLAPTICVEDESTRLLAENFYHNLQLGKSRAEALRSAQLFIRDKSEGRQHPCYWAFFQLAVNHQDGL